MIVESELTKVSGSTLTIDSDHTKKQLPTGSFPWQLLLVLYFKLQFIGERGERDWEELLERSSPQTPFKNFQ